MTNFGYWEKEFGNADTRGLPAGCSISSKEIDVKDDNKTEDECEDIKNENISDI